MYIKLTVLDIMVRVVKKYGCLPVKFQCGNKCHVCLQPCPLSPTRRAPTPEPDERYEHPAMTSSHYEVTYSDFLNNHQNIL